MLQLNAEKGRGDTIIEVMLAIGVAAFAIGVTYATAARALDQTITAREHSQALNIVQNQLTDLRLRFAKSDTSVEFNHFFGDSNNHFCLDDSATNVIQHTPWTPYFNYAGTNESSPLLSAPIPKPNVPYVDSCTRHNSGDGATYFIDIQTASLTDQAQNPTVYQVFVRWERIGGGRAQASLYYRPNGGASQTLGYAFPYSLDKLYPYRGTTNES